ncbi:TPA: restriction endonuclease [Vibrio parahaemolyticus]|nr:restriction endonuclease [Vibrio parahaemolyticus]
MSGVFDAFYRNMNDEQWEFFAIDFLASLGFTIIDPPSRGPDGGKDGLVEANNQRFIVSCKHFINSGSAVGVSDEQSIVDRMVHHKARGFIGFYSTVISSSLATRLNSFKESGYQYMVFDQYKIGQILPRIPSSVLQKYALPNGVKFVNNVPLDQYIPLNCLGCGKDILTDGMINWSMAMILLNNSNQLEFMYGCKKCMSNYNNLGWVEVSQVLHQEELNSWNSMIEELVSKHPVSSGFYRHKSNFDSRLLQRMYPSNWGRWLYP